MGSPERRLSLGNNEPTPKKAKLATDYVCKALDCIVFRLVDHEADMPLAAPEFKPEYAHQLFGETEEISGYTGLHIDLTLSAATAHVLLETKWTQKRYICDDIDSVLHETFSEGSTRSVEQFKALLNTPAPDYSNMGGRTVGEMRLKDGSEVVIQLHHLSTAHEEIQALHARLEPLLLFFMDGASKIEADDKWDLMLALQSSGGKTRVVGFSTIYNYFAYPEGIRPRLSQVFILPPFQGKGLGTALLQAAYQLAKEREAPDLTIEDPSPELQTLRQRLELRTLEALPWFCEQADALIDSALQSTGTSTQNGAAAKSGGADDVSRLQLPREVLRQIQEERKIHAAEARQVWEAYLWQHPRMKGAGTRQLLLMAIKQRLHTQHFSPVERNARGKSIRDLSTDGCVFEMRRRRQEGPGSEDAGASGSGAGDSGAVNVGSGRNVSQVSLEDIEQALHLLLQERTEELERVTRRADS